MPAGRPVGRSDTAVHFFLEIPVRVSVENPVQFVVMSAGVHQ